MNIKQFEVLIDTYGSNLRRWPARPRAAAARLLAEVPEAVAALRAARRLDALLAQPRPASDPQRHERIIAAALRQARAAPPRRQWRAALFGLRVAPMRLAFAATVLAGLFIGFLSSRAEVAASRDVPAVYALLGSSTFIERGLQ